jgi:hypothetical protein
LFLCQGGLCVKWTHFRGSERCLHKVLNIRCDQKKTDINIEVQILSVVGKKEFWSWSRVAKDSMLLIFCDHCSAQNVNKMRIFRDPRSNLKILPLSIWRRVGVYIKE